MSGAATVVVIVVIIVVIALLAAASAAARRRRLQQKFGPEYDRVATEQNSKIRADAELTERQRRVRKLDIRPLPEEARRRYADQWVAIQEQFVDAPQTAVRDAYALVTTVMRERGYPVDDDTQVMADLSVEHADTVGHFRAAQEIIGGGAVNGDIATEELRQAFIHYRALFADLLGEPVALNGSHAADGSPAANGRFGNEGSAAYQQPSSAAETQPGDYVVGTRAGDQSDYPQH